MLVFIERIGELYVGIAHDDDGRKLLEIAEPVSDLEIHATMKSVSDDGDCLDVDCAIDEADQRPNDGRDAERKFFHMIRVRAYAGLASESDGQYVLEQLNNPDSVHDTIFLLWTLGYMGAQYEDAVRPFLDSADARESEHAMSAVFQMGLYDKYVDRFVGWMRSARANEPLSTIYGMAAYAFRQSQRSEILKALIEASNDKTEKWTPREHARSCLAQAIDLESAPLGERLPWNHPYFVGVVAKAEDLLAQMVTRTRDTDVGGH
jgi:hypothetical protein